MVLFVISHQNASKVFEPLAMSCIRQNISYECFFTGIGVKNLNESALEYVIQSAQKSIVCHQSWEIHCQNNKSPVEEGSQTNLSEMIAKHDRVISL